MMEDEFVEIQILPEGVYKVHYKKMSMRTARSMHTRLRSRLWQLHREQENLAKKQRLLNRKIEEVERQLNTLRRFLIENDPKYGPEIKGEEVLRKYLGEEAYSKFLKDFEIEFESKNGCKYKIDYAGNLYKKVAGAWRYVCISHSPKLPLGDRIVAIS